ncbi:Sdh6 protein [Martiniozyma asiatica (nom. inval.)]|nr:Sdh6 protein [Martiniozyma asiatica]
MSNKLSGLQREVLSLYRNCLRGIYQKPKQFHKNWFNYIHAEFNRHRNIPRRNFATVEHLLRVGTRRYEMYKSPDIKNVF